MSTAMILCALQFCPDKVTPLYAPLGEDVRPTNVLQHTRAAQRRRDLCTAVEHGRFAAAVPLVPERAEQLGIADYAHRTLRAILASAEQRLRFDLVGARQSLVTARREAQLSDEVHSQIALLHNSLPANSDIAGLLAELYHNAGQKLRHHEYADFVLRLFNFQQAALRHAAERAGVTFYRNGEYLTPECLQAHPDFEQFVATCAAPDGSEQIELQGGRATGPLLLCLAAYLQKEGKLPTALQPVAQHLQQVAGLRNRCFATHDFRTVGRADLEAAFDGTNDDILEAMAMLYEGATGRTLGPDPFGVTERLARDLLATER
jgi:hypothetical protein